MPESAIEKRHSNEWLKQRIDMNRQARFGLEQATSAQLNVVAVLARRWGLDPVTDITLYQGHPWITVEGHMRKMREHPDFRGVRQRPLTEEEKIAGGWSATDRVWQTDLDTAKWGTISQWGKVTQEEIDEAQSAAKRSGKRAAPLGMHPVEIAQKRSLARACRLAFGMDAPDEEQVERELEEEMARRNNPVTIREGAATYDRIYAEPELPMSGAERQLRERVAEAFEEDFAEAGTTAAEVEEEETEPAEPPTPAPSPDPWTENRRLYFDAVNAGLRPKTLRNDTPLEQVEAYNQQLAEQIQARRVPSTP